MIKCYTSRQEDVLSYTFLRTILLFLACTAFAASAAAQSTSLGDLGSVTWKGTPEATNVLTEEQTKMAQVQNAPGVHYTDVALYKAYERVLQQMQTRLQAGETMQDALVHSYDKVLTDAPDDPELKNMQPEGLNVLMTFLVEQLTHVPVPVVDGQ